MPRATAPTLDTDRVRAAVRARLGSDLESRRLLDRYLGALTPARWTIEWHLPWWLAARFQLGEQLGRELVESNVLGLLAVRITDDSVDGDVAPRDAGAARSLAAAALDAALQPYRALFPPSSPFWSHFERSMAEWQAGADGPEHATRAAPIRIAAYACCLLAGRTDLWPSLEGCLDHAMTALVLYDQFFDWEADVDAGRWNAFVAEVAGPLPVAGHAERIRASVLTAMLTREVVAEHFGRVAAEADAAMELACELGLDDLGASMHTWRATAVAQGDDAADHYRRAADQATRLLFPHAVGTQVRGGTA